MEGRNRAAALPGLDERQVVETFLTLVRIDSPSGEEAALAAHLAAALQALDMEVERDPAGNVVARRAGRGTLADNAPLLLSAHMDTVQPGRSVRPVMQDGTIRTDGTTVLGADDKAGITAILEALRHASRAHLDCRPVEVAFTVEEETGLTGAKQLDKDRLRARQALVLDSNGPLGSIINRAPAQNSLAAVIRGRAAHAGVSPELGVNAIQAAAQGIASMRLGRIDAETTANIGTISGGTATNIVPDLAQLKGETRSRDASKLEAQTAHMVDALREAAARYGATAEVTVTRSYGAIDIAADSPLIRRLETVLRSCGLEPRLAATGGGSDANVLNAAGIEAVNLGVGFVNMHSVEEQIAVADLVKAAEVVLAVLTT